MATKRRVKSMKMGTYYWGELDGDELVLQNETKRVRLKLDPDGVVWIAGHLQDWLDKKQSAIDRARDALYEAGKRTVVKP